MLSVDWLFLDMNSFFASAEQHLQPALRGQPVAVVPTMTDRTCCIAVSYEARPYGIKTGTNVGEARRRCPGLRIVAGRHENYVRIHHQIIAAVETVLPVTKVCSIDEMVCQLSPQHREVGRAVELAREVKQAIYDQVGECLRCSVGLATNRFLAKVASNMQKPDGLSVITREELPRRLYGLELTDFPGIAGNMRRRLASKGIRTTRQLCGLSRKQMIDAWQSVLGEQWWYRLRGDEPVGDGMADKATTRRTVGHSHVLPPKLRTDEGARGVLVRLLHKAAMRLRRMDYWAAQMVVALRYSGDWPKWKNRLPRPMSRHALAAKSLGTRVGRAPCGSASFSSVDHAVRSYARCQHDAFVVSRRTPRPSSNSSDGCCQRAVWPQHTLFRLHARNSQRRAHADRIYEHSRERCHLTLLDTVIYLK